MLVVSDLNAEPKQTTTTTVTEHVMVPRTVVTGTTPPAVPQPANVVKTAG